jgi:nitroreductase
MEYREVIRRRRMVRRYQPDKPVPPEVVDRIVRSALRAPSAGFSQGWGFLVLDKPADVARFRAACTPEKDPENWFAANVEAPLLVVPLSNKDAYLDRYARPDKGFTDRSDAWWPAPYWDIDTGMAALLMLLSAVDEGLGACFFGIPVDRIAAVKEAFQVPERYHPIGAVSIGYSDEPARDVSARRRPVEQVIHYSRWSRADTAG